MPKQLSTKKNNVKLDKNNVLPEEKMFGKYAQMTEEDIRKGGGGRGPGRGGGGPMGGRLFGEKPKNSKQTLGRIIKYLGSNKRYLIILIFIVFITSFASILTPVLSGAAIDAIPLRSSIVLNTDEEGNITHSELREINEGTEGLILALSKDNKWIINQEQTEVIGYKNDDKAFQSFNHIIIKESKYFG